jgi:proteic killer suppression protein
MIESFRSKGLQAFFEKGDHSKIKPDHRKRIRLILTLLQGSLEVTDMNFPESDFHPLKGNFKDFWSVKVSGNWRIIFRFKDGNAFDVDYLDYH